MSYIDTERASSSLREKAIDIVKKTILITNYANSEQEKDFTEPSNCDGFGRIRHFKLNASTNWPMNPLPILPAQKKLHLIPSNTIRAQVFQNAVCNWRCWYCFVDFKLLSGNKKFSEPQTCEHMLDLYQAEENPPSMIDLTGGQPDITPEWIPWMMEVLIKRGLDKKIYLWSDDNLSNDYFWRYLTVDQINLIRNYENYGRVCCFKGIDEKSFSLNTGADPSLYQNQFHLFEKLLKLGIDLYSYITLTAPTKSNFRDDILRFFDKIQTIDEQYPLRIIPLQIFEFSPVVSRIKELESDLLSGQSIAIEYWQEELSKRFSPAQIKIPVTDISTKYQTR